MKFMKLLAVVALTATALPLDLSMTIASAATFAKPDTATLVTSSWSSTGLLGNGPLNDTATAQPWLNSYYEPSDHLYESYLGASSTLHLTWQVDGPTGAPLANTSVTLGDNLAYSNAKGTTWSVAGLNSNPNTTGNNYQGGTMSGTTNSAGLVTFTVTNTNIASGAAPTNETSTDAARANEGPYPWTRFYLVIGNDVITAAPNTTVNETTDLVDVIVIPAPAVAKVGTRSDTVAMNATQRFTFGSSTASLNATVSPRTSGTVTFSVGSTTLCTATVSAGTASCTPTTTLVSGGTARLTATFSGNATYKKSSVTKSLVIAKATSSVAVTPLASSVSQNNVGGFSAGVAVSSPSGITPSGNVTLRLDGLTLTTAAAPFTWSFVNAGTLSTGTHTLTASYAGSASFLSSTTSATFTVTAPTGGSSVPLPSTSTNYDINHGTQLWSETFTGATGTSPSSTYWTPEVGLGVGVAPGLANWTYGTGEIETTTANPANVSSDGVGNLAITATCTTSCQSNGNWTSARISTAGKVNFQYGQLEANIKLPAGSYNWPAFWMLGKNFFPNGSWPNCGEIDIMEGLGNNSVDQSTIHANYPNSATDWNGGGGVTLHAPLSNISAGFHTFGMIWTPTSLSFTLDGYVYGSDVYNASAGTVTQYATGGGTNVFNIGGQVWPFDQPFFMILQDAIPAGTSAPNGSSATMDVNWIKYYSYDGLGATS